MESLASLKPAFQEQGEKYGFNSVMLQRYPEVEKHRPRASRRQQLRHRRWRGRRAVRHQGDGRGAGPEAARTDPLLRLDRFRALDHADRPSYAAEKALKRAGMKVGDIDLFELNEAFAAVVLRFMQVLDVGTTG
jgi:acetyl-CoA C-acetyltransferase